MNKAEKLFLKFAQTSSKLHWYGPKHPRAKAIRSEFARQGTPISARFPVVTDTSKVGITHMGYRGTGFKATVLRKNPTTSRDTVGIGAASNYLFGVANTRGYALHAMSKWVKK